MANPAGGEDKEIKEGKIFAVMAYLSILCIVALILKKENKFTLFHGKQGLVLFIAEIIFFMFNFIPFIGAIVFSIGMLLCGLVSVWGLIQALSGNFARIPFVYNIAKEISL